MLQYHLILQDKNLLLIIIWVCVLQQRTERLSRHSITLTGQKTQTIKPSVSEAFMSWRHTPGKSLSRTCIQSTCHHLFRRCAMQREPGHGPSSLPCFLPLTLECLEAVDGKISLLKTWDASGGIKDLSLKGKWNITPEKTDKQEENGCFLPSHCWVNGAMEREGAKLWQLRAVLA